MEVPLLQRKISRENCYELRRIKEGEKIPLVSDTMFDVMLNNESRKKYVCYFLSLILDKSFEELMEKIRFIKKEIDKENYHSSKKTVDFVCKFDEEILNIEMNNNTTASKLERNIAYVGDLYKSKMFRGSDYDYQKVIQINLNNFSFEGQTETIEEYMFQSSEGEILTDKMKIIYFSLPKIKEKYYNKEKLSEVEKLLLVFNEQSSKELEELMEGNKIMKEYQEESLETSQKEEIIGLYDKELLDEYLAYHELKHARETGLAEGREEGMKEGVEEGALEASRKIATKMLQKGEELKKISEYTGLSLDEIKKL